MLPMINAENCDTLLQLPVMETNPAKAELVIVKIENFEVVFSFLSSAKNTFLKMDPDAIAEHEDKIVLNTDMAV